MSEISVTISRVLIKKNLFYYATKSGSNSLRSLHIKEINSARLISAEYSQTFPYRVFRILFNFRPLKIIKSTGQHFYYHINMHKKQASCVLLRQSPWQPDKHWQWIYHGNCSYESVGRPVSSKLQKSKSRKRYKRI